MRLSNVALGPFASKFNTPGSSATAISGPINLSDFVDDLDAVIVGVDYPSLTTAQLPNTQSLTFTLISSNNSSMTPIITSNVMGTLTSASSSTPASSGTFAIHPPYTGGKYYAVQVGTSATAAASGALQSAYIAIK